MLMAIIMAGGAIKCRIYIISIYNFTKNYEIWNFLCFFVEPSQLN
jgi:hypothetical protein